MREDRVREQKRAAGSAGGKAGTVEQKRARLVNLYKGLAKKWPNSATVRRKLAELERAGG